MPFAGSRDDAASKNFGDDLRRLAGAIDAKIGQLIGRQALRMELAEARFVAKERAAGHCHAAGEQNFDRRSEAKDRYSGGAKKCGAALLGVRAAAESENRAFAKFSGAAEGSAKLIGFELAEGRLAVAFEKLRDGDASGGFDAVIEVHEAPPELASEHGSNSSFAGAHEPGEGKDGQAWRLRHGKIRARSLRLRPAVNLLAFLPGAKPVPPTRKAIKIQPDSTRAPGSGLLVLS